MVGLLLLTYNDSRSEKNKCIEQICDADIAKMTLVERPEAADDGVALRADQRLSWQSIKDKNSNRRNRKYTCQDVQSQVHEVLIIM